MPTDQPEGKTGAFALEPCRKRTGADQEPGGNRPVLPNG